jgi:hypothetical protein
MVSLSVTEKNQIKARMESTLNTIMELESKSTLLLPPSQGIITANIFTIGFDLMLRDYTKKGVLRIRDFSKELAACRTTYCYSELSNNSDKYYWSCCGAQTKEHPAPHSVQFKISDQNKNKKTQ